MPVKPPSPARPAPMSVESRQQGGVRALAVNLFDLDRIPQIVREAMLAGKLDLTGVVVTDGGRVDETAVAFSCDLLTAAALLDVIRGNDRRAKSHPTRVYVKRQAWSKLPGAETLTVIERGRVALNPDVFGVGPVAMDGSDQPAACRVEF